MLLLRYGIWSLVNVVPPSKVTNSLLRLLDFPMVRSWLDLKMEFCIFGTPMEQKPKTSKLIATLLDKSSKYQMWVFWLAVTTLKSNCSDSEIWKNTANFLIFMKNSSSLLPVWVGQISSLVVKTIDSRLTSEERKRMKYYFRLHVGKLSSISIMTRIFLSLVVMGKLTNFSQF